MKMKKYIVPIVSFLTGAILSGAVAYFSFSFFLEVLYFEENRIKQEGYLSVLESIRKGEDDKALEKLELFACGFYFAASLDESGLLLESEVKERTDAYFAKYNPGFLEECKITSFSNRASRQGRFAHLEKR